MTSARTVLLLAGLATVLLCAQMAPAAAAASDSATGTVNLTVEKYVDIYIPQHTTGDGTEPFPGYADVPWQYPMKQVTGPGIGRVGVTPDLVQNGLTVKLSTSAMKVFATANCKVWIRIPQTLTLTDHGTYQCTATVLREPGDKTWKASLQYGGYFYDHYGALSANSYIAKVTVWYQKQWGPSDIAGLYWGTLFVDLLASDVGEGGSQPPPDTLPWPGHTEPTYPPHSF